MATLVQAPEDVVVALERKVVDTSTLLPEKYRVLFSLRNVAGTAATKALITGGCVACAAFLCGWPDVGCPVVPYLSSCSICLLQGALDPLHSLLTDISTAAAIILHM
jgi:hypothetical protein